MRFGFVPSVARMCTSWCRTDRTGSSRLPPSQVLAEGGVLSDHALERFAPTLAVAWRTGQKVHARRLNIGGELQDYLQQIVTDVDSLISQVTIEDYRPDGGDAEADVLFAAKRDDRIDAALIDELARGEDLDFASEAELRKRHLSCYAIVRGAGADQRIYVRRQDPVKLASKRLFAALLDGPLTELDSPVLAFDDYIDVVIERDRIIVLNPKGFESLFRDSEAVLAAVPKWVDELRVHVSFSDESAGILQAAVRRNSVHRNKLLAILDSDHVASLTPKRIRKRMKQHGLDHAGLLVGDTLHLTEESLSDVLKLLNEDLYKGDFSDVHFAASSKRPFRR